MQEFIALSDVLLVVVQIQYNVDAAGNAILREIQSAIDLCGSTVFVPAQRIDGRKWDGPKTVDPHTM